MSKRKPATASKHVRNPNIATKAQRASQAIVRSPKVRLRSVAADSAESSPKRRNDSKPVAPPCYTSGSPCYRESSDSPTRRFQKDDDG